MLIGYGGLMVMNNRVLILFLLIFFVFINSGKASDLERQLTILYTADTKGYVEGCG